MMALRVATALILLLGLAGPVRGAPENARELGRVRWERDFGAGVERARTEGRPIFLLFQEVPGCANCVGFGESVLSHPLVVEAIENEFVPVAIYNNEGGADRAVLRRFGEPAWNNPVVRFVDADGRDLIPRVDRVWSTHGIATRMIASLEAAGRAAPGYLRIAAEESRARTTQRATFQTHCFWEGEVCLGTLPGVVSTEAAWLDGSEVVEVGFDPRATDYAALLRGARARGCASAVFAHDGTQLREAEAVYGDRARVSEAPPRRAPAADQKRHLRASPLRALDLTPLQQTRVNAALATGGDPLQWLSPSQRQAADALL